MTQEHPVIPPPELVRKWQLEIEYCSRRADREAFVAKVFQLGSDYELEACCEWISMHTTWDSNRLHTARRPRQQSLKEQALTLIDKIQANKEMWQTDDLDLVRQALEQLND